MASDDQAVIDRGVGPQEATVARRAALVAALARLDRVLEAACDSAEHLYGSQTESDPYRGFYVTPQDFRQLLGRAPGAPLFHVDSSAGDPPLAEIQRTFGLSAFDIDVLLI